MLWHGWCTDELVAAMAIYIRTSQSTFQLGWRGTQEAPPIAKELLATDGSWKGVSFFFRGVGASRLPTLWCVSPHDCI